MRTYLYPLLALSVVEGLAAGCSPRVFGVRTTARALGHGAPAIFAESDPVLAEQAMPSQLKLLEVFLANDPDNAELLRLGARAFAGYANLFVEDADPARAAALYERARAFGLRALPCAPKDPACLAQLGKNDVEALFWTAYAWAGKARLTLDSPDSVAALPLLEKMMERVEALSPGYFYGGPDLFLGAYYGGRSRMLGGDPARAKAHLEKAVSHSGGKFLTSLLLYAQYYGVQSQDRELFARMLRKVSETSAAVLPEQRLANEVAKRKAKALLRRENELFE